MSAAIIPTNPNVDAHTSNNQETHEMTDADAEEYIKQQREMNESIDSLTRQLERVKVTRAERIDSLKLFTPQGEQSKSRQIYIIDASKKAHQHIETHGAADLESAEALVDELLICLNNDLMLSELSEEYFAITVPNYSIRINLNDIEISDELTGLLIYRTWQIIVRTPHGRSILLNSEFKVKPFKPEFTDSYSAVHQVILQALKSNQILQLLKECILDLPYPGSNEQNLTTLTPLERSHLLQNINNMTVDIQSLPCNFT